MIIVEKKEYLKKIYNLGEMELNENGNTETNNLSLFKNYINSLSSDNKYINKLLNDFIDLETVKENAIILQKINIKLSLKLHYWLSLNDIENSNIFLGKFFLGEYGGKRNSSLAIYFFERLKKTNPGLGHFMIGWTYYMCEDEIKYKNDILENYYKSAEYNNVNAFYNLGVIYTNGELGETDIKKGQYYFQLAKENNHVFAKYASSISQNKFLNKKNILKTKSYIILYLDVLGYKDDIERTDEHHYLKKFDRMINQIIYAENSKIDNPFFAAFEPKKVLYRMFSDNVIVAIKMSEYEYENAIKIQYMIKLAANIEYYSAIRYGIFVRGSLTIGNLYYSNKYIYGNGLIRAYMLENVAKYPLVLVDDSVINYFKEINSQKKYKKPSKDELKNVYNIMVQKIDYYNFIENEEILEHKKKINECINNIEDSEKFDFLENDFICSIENIYNTIVHDFETYFFQFNDIEMTGKYLNFINVYITCNQYFLSKEEIINLFKMLFFITEKKLEEFSNNEIIHEKFLMLKNYIEEIKNIYEEIGIYE